MIAAVQVEFHHGGEERYLFLKSFFVGIDCSAALITMYVKEEYRLEYIHRWVYFI